MLIVNAVVALHCSEAFKMMCHILSSCLHVLKSFYFMSRSLLWRMNTLNGWHGGHLEEVPEVEKLSIQKGKIKLCNGLACLHL